MDDLDPTPDQDPRLPAALLDPAAFPRGEGAAPELIETHISWVFLVGARVYKVKKAVDLGFLDMTSRALRRHFCAEEVRLNAELAPGVHLGVAPIVARGGRLVVDPPVGVDESEAIEWAVAMRRLPARFMLEHLLAEGELDNALLEFLAERLARFHAGAATGAGIDEHGALEAVRRNVAQNFAQCRAFAGLGPEPDGVSTLSPRLFDFLQVAQLGFLEDHTELLDRRVRAGRIREGHGDLHASNICLEPDPGEPTGRRLSIFDRIEFGAHLRCGDVAADLAFLAMDMDRRGFRAFSSYLARRYGELAGDPELEELLPFYKTYRAIVRAKVGSLRAAQEPPGSATRERERALAAEHFHLAASYHLGPGLILTAGLPASGKSTLARYLAGALGAALHGSDATRKRLSQRAPHSRASAGEDPFSGFYGAQATDRTYGALLEAARADLGAGRAVVIDAASPTRARRAPFQALAHELGAPFALALVTCPEELLARRFAARAADPSEVSDADERVRAAMAARFEPPDEIAPPERFEYRSDEPLDRAMALLVELWMSSARA